MIRVAGLVTQRQWPKNAKGVTFVTLEDETGFINAVVWQDLSERYRKPLLRSKLMSITGKLQRGKLQREGDVIYIVARSLEDYTWLLWRSRTDSRDFR